MNVVHELVAVAFLRSAGGRVRVLLAVDRDGQQLHDGEPVLLVEHRPGAAPDRIHVEPASVLPEGAVQHVLDARVELAGLVDACMTADGGFDGDLLLGRAVRIHAPSSSFA